MGNLAGVSKGRSSLLSIVFPDKFRPYDRLHRVPADLRRQVAVPKRRQVQEEEESLRQEPRRRARKGPLRAGGERGATGRVRAQSAEAASGPSRRARHSRMGHRRRLHLGRTLRGFRLRPDFRERRHLPVHRRRDLHTLQLRPRGLSDLRAFWTLPWDKIRTELKSFSLRYCCRHYSSALAARARGSQTRTPTKTRNRRSSIGTKIVRRCGGRKRRRSQTGVTSARCSASNSSTAACKKSR